MPRSTQPVDPLNSGNRPGDGPLRVGGTPAATPGPQPESNLPSKMSKAAERQQATLGIVRDLAEGCAKVQELGQTYLPTAPGERPEDYKVRLDRAVFFEFFGDTIDGLVGMIASKDPKLGDDVPAEIRGDDESGDGGHWENIDNAGTHGAVFVRELAQDALTAGHAGILVEFPQTGGTQTAKQEASEIRPYWVPIRKDNIMSWRTTVENGVTVLTQLVLKECTMVPDGEFGEREQTRYRVLYRDNGIVGFRLYEVDQSKRIAWVVDEGLYPTQDEIPFAEIVTSGRRGLLESKPPLLGVAFLNLAHYRQWSDYDTSLHMTCVPLFTRIGFQAPVDERGNEMKLGPKDGLDLPVGGDAKYVSHDGAALGSVKECLDDLVSQIASLGMSMLASQKRVAETATAKRIDKRATDSALAVTARGIQDGLERALYFHARYLRYEDGGSIQVNRDFENLTLDPQTIAALSQLVVNGQITLETLWKMLQQGAVLPEDFDGDAEAAMLAADAEIKRQTALAIAEAQPKQLPPGQQGGQMDMNPSGGSMDRAA